MRLRIDRIQMTSLFESFKNYRVNDPLMEFSIALSGSVPVGGKEFTHTISYDRTGTLADVYYKKVGGTYKRPLNPLQRIPDYAGATFANTFVRYTSGSVIVGIYIANPGGSPITASSETYNFQVKLFDAPIAN